MTDSWYQIVQPSRPPNRLGWLGAAGASHSSVAPLLCARTGGQVKPSLAPVRTDLLNASGSRRIMQENLAKATERDRRWSATTVKNVLDRANVAGVKEAA